MEWKYHPYGGQELQLVSAQLPSNLLFLALEIPNPAPKQDQDKQRAGTGFYIPLRDITYPLTLCYQHQQ